ncbi:DUF3299 domain-containing protein [Marinicauda salina]|uniref:DUF3299 domain-containing protein n=1 Tax=Marinicauda salina TaxID=2135793 RepID=A0A2U2BQT0_9PROT|nr:DUF3299 domain-containing protein [Marinicauda salina]PWE16364.1 DUF3299 domain-containing protein [Marinicauda salina]
MTRTLILALAAVFALVAAEARAQSSAPRELEWSDLLPEGEARNIARLQEMQANAMGMDHFGVDRMPQIRTYNVVDALDGERVKIGGYVLPFDYAADRAVSRFLLVPYVGACIHVPPPPPNQLIFVEAEEPVEVDGMWDPVWAVGVMRTRRTDNDLGDTAYTLELTELRPYTE